MPNYAFSRTNLRYYNCHSCSPQDSHSFQDVESPLLPLIAFDQEWGKFWIWPKFANKLNWKWKLLSSQQQLSPSVFGFDLNPSKHFRQPNAWFGIIISAVAIGQYQQWSITTFNTIQKQIVCFPVLSTSFAFIHAAVSPGSLFHPSYAVKQWSRQVSHVYEQLVLVSVLSVCLWNCDTLIFLQLLSSTSAKYLGYTFSH